MLFWKKAQKKIQVLPETEKGEPERLVRCESEDFSRLRSRRREEERGRGRECGREGRREKEIGGREREGRESMTIGRCTPENLEDGGKEGASFAGIRFGEVLEKKKKEEEERVYDTVRGTTKWNQEELLSASREGGNAKALWRERRLERLKTTNDSDWSRSLEDMEDSSKPMGRGTSLENGRDMEREREFKREGYLGREIEDEEFERESQGFGKQEEIEFSMGRTRGIRENQYQEEREGRGKKGSNALSERNGTVMIRKVPRVNLPATGMKPTNTSENGQVYSSPTSSPRFSPSPSPSPYPYPSLSPSSSPLSPYGTQFSNSSSHCPSESTIPIKKLPTASTLGNNQISKWENPGNKTNFEIFLKPGDKTNSFNINSSTENHKGLLITSVSSSYASTSPPSSSPKSLRDYALENNRNSIGTIPIKKLPRASSLPENIQGKNWDLLSPYNSKISFQTRNKDPLLLSESESGSYKHSPSPPPLCPKLSPSRLHNIRTSSPSLPSSPPRLPMSTDSMIKEDSFETDSGSPSGVSCFPSPSPSNSPSISPSHSPRVYRVFQNQYPPKPSAPPKMSSPSHPSQSPRPLPKTVYSPVSIPPTTSSISHFPELNILLPSSLSRSKLNLSVQSNRGEERILGSDYLSETFSKNVNFDQIRTQNLSNTEGESEKIPSINPEESSADDSRQRETGSMGNGEEVEAQGGEGEERSRTLEEIGLALFGSSFAARDKEVDSGEGKTEGAVRKIGGENDSHEKDFEFQGIIRPSVGGNIPHPDSPGCSPSGRMSLKPRKWPKFGRTRSGHHTPLILEPQEPKDPEDDFGPPAHGLNLARGGSLPVKFDLTQILNEAQEQKDDNKNGKSNHLKHKARSVGDPNDIGDCGDPQESALAKKWKRAQKKLVALHALQFSGGRPTNGALTGPVTPVRMSPFARSPLQTKRGDGKPPRPGTAFLTKNYSVDFYTETTPTNQGTSRTATRTKSTGKAAQLPMRTPSRGGSLPKDLKLSKFDALGLRAQHVQFQLAELQLATEGFSSSQILGRGGFGTVYRGELPGDKRQVAVKALKSHAGLQQQQDCEFRTELQLLSRLEHRNLVKLLGFCSTPKQKLLVYQYLPNGSLYDHLHGRNSESRPPITWSRRLRIALGAARGLRYLHAQSPQVLHRDIKASNILLTKAFEAKIADLGCARILRPQDPSTEERQGADGRQRLVDFVDVGVGTVGHMAPEVLMAGEISAASDVYSFGVVLLELLTGREAVDRSQPKSSQNLVSWALPLIEDHQWKVFLDPFLIETEGVTEESALCRLARLAEGCVQFDPLLRPSCDVITTYLSVLAQDKSEGLPVLTHSQRVSGGSFPGSPGTCYSSGSSETATPNRDDDSFPSPKRNPVEYARAMQAMISLIEEGQGQLEWSGGLQQCIGRQPTPA